MWTLLNAACCAGLSAVCSTCMMGLCKIFRPGLCKINPALTGQTDRQTNGQNLSLGLYQYMGGSRILQRWVSNPSERGTRGWAPKAPRGLCLGIGSGEGLYQNGDFLCIPGDIYWHCNCINDMFWTYIFLNGTLIKRAGVWTPWTPLDPPLPIGCFCCIWYSDVA